jgi:DNA polymerase-1
MSRQGKKLMIIDGNAVIHRSFHALPPTMRTKKGEMVNAVYGFATVLFKALRELRPDFVVLTLDKKGPTFRHKEYKEYKATRVKAPDELYMQIPRVKELARALGIPIYEKKGFEADDLIGTITSKVNGKVEKIIVTGDLDALQLVDNKTKVYTMSRGLSDSVLYDPQTVQARYGLEPEQMIDFKALRGDPSDNIPGVRGIGEKTAVALLQQFKTLDKIYDYLKKNPGGREKIKPRVIELLLKYEEMSRLSRRLATIKRDVKIDFDLNAARFGKIKKEEAIKILSELEFKSLLPRLKELISRATAISSVAQREEAAADKFRRNRKKFKYILVDNDKKFNLFLRQLKKQKSFTFDIETSSFDPLTAKLLGISFSWRAGEAYYLNFAGDKIEENNKQINLFSYNLNTAGYTNKKEDVFYHSWLEKVRPIFESAAVKKYGHNIKFDWRVMRHQGVVVAGLDFDTMIASYLLNPGTRQHNLDAVVFTELGYEKISKNDLLGKGRERIDFSEVDLKKLYLYSCEDADFTWRLVKKLRPRLRTQKLDKLFSEIEIPLITVLAQMEDNGIKIKRLVLTNLKREVDRKLAQLEKKIYKQAGVKFNINSTQQLREVLYEKLNIPTDNISKTKTGLSTAAEELVKLKDLHPIIPLLQEYRELVKLKNTYIDALPRLINAKTGRLHTNFNQTVTATGRLSSTEPNLQNIPVRSRLGRQIRRAFVAERGYRLVSLDYSQIELRLAAHMSGDKKMIAAFRAGADIHTATAAEIHQVNPETVTPAMRREAKAINFGILYGQGPHGLAQTADIPYWRAKEFIEQYFIVYKDIKKFINQTIKQARAKGYVQTLFGRRRYLPEINSSVAQVRKAAERMAINTPLQGTAADMIKVAMIEVAHWLDEFNINSLNKPRARMLLQVHDELLLEVKNDQTKEAIVKIKKIMERVIKLKVPVVVDVKIGSNWGEMQELTI